MAKDSLFSILLRSPWWVSVLAGGLLAAIVYQFFPQVALFVALPFLVIAAYAGWRQLRVPGVARTADLLGSLRTMSWENFSAVIAEAFRRDGYNVTEIAEGAADLELRKNGRVSVASCKRWKVAQTGVGPLHELREAMRARSADDCIYVAAGDFTANARKFAAEKAIRLLSDAALVQLVARVERGRRRWNPF